MPAVVKPLFMEQGATFTMGFNWYMGPEVEGGDPIPYDVVGKSARMQIRQKITSPVLVEASTENGRITLGPDGRVDIRLRAGDTMLLTTRAAVYDLEIVLDPRPEYDDVRRVLKGPVTIDPNVTRETP